MTLQPETLTTIYTRVRDAIIAASTITNFSPNSPERAITRDGFSEEMRERQHEALAVQLSARIDYAGRGTDDSEETISRDDLEDLGLPNPEDVDLDLLNAFIERDDLDALAKRNGVTRDPGAFATGQVEFTVSSDSVVIPEGTEVGTDPDGSGNYLSFTTDAEVSPSQGSTTVTADVTAAERGSEYNVGSGSITYLPSPPPGVQSVTNPSATTDGEDEETNEALRNRTKNALVNNSGGGTLDGVEGGLVKAFDGLDLEDVIVDEFPSATPPYADVIVDGGGTDQEVTDEIDKLRPVAIEHNLIRPTDITIDISADVSGSDIDTAAVEQDLTDYLSSLGLGEDVIRDQIIATIMNADVDISGISSLTVSDSGGTISDDKTIGSREKAVPGTVSVTVV